jgi:hypothetical protein
MRRFLFALVAGGSLAACGLYFDDSKQGSGTDPTRPDAPQHPYPDASTDDGGSHPDAGEPCEDGGVYHDGGEYPDAWPYPDAPDYPDAGDPHYPDAP